MLLQIFLMPVWILLQFSTKAGYKCASTKEEFSKKIIYTNVDKKAENKGGFAEFTKQFLKRDLDTISDDWVGRFLVAFIVNSDGSISDERVIRDKTKAGKIGLQMIEVAKILQWTPAQCGSKKVPTLVELPLQICPAFE